MPLFEHDDREAVAKTIRDYFVTLGGAVPLRELAIKLQRNNVLPQPVVDACTRRGLMDLCRKALRAKTDERLPFAQPTGDSRRARWVQLDLFTRVQAYALLNRRSKGMADDFDELRHLHAWCLEKFGSAPEIPELIMPTTDDGDDVRAQYDANLEEE